MYAVSIVLVIVGSIMVYGVKYILGVLKLELNEVGIVIFKLVGLILAGIGFFRILEII